MTQDRDAFDGQRGQPTNAAPRAHEAQGRGVLVAFIFTLVTLQGLMVNLMPLLFGTVARAFDDVNLRQQGQLQSFFLAGGIVALFVSGYVTETLRARR